MNIDNKFKELCAELAGIVQRRRAYLLTFNGQGQHMIFDVITKQTIDICVASELSESHFPAEFGEEVDQQISLPFNIEGYWFANISSDEERIYLALCASHAVDQQDALLLFYKVRWLTQSFISKKLAERLDAANAWIDGELQDIGEIQTGLLPDASQKINGVDYAYSYQAMKNAGGDYIDIVNFTKQANERDNFGLIVADVTGHGVAASIETAMLDAILRTYRPTDRTIKPSEVLSYINRHFFTRIDRGRFITVNIFRYFDETRTLYYANAGHPPAYLVRRGKLIKLDQGGIPLGVIREATWESYSISIESGDMLFIYTDAVVEARNPYDICFDFDNLERLLGLPYDSPRALIDKIYQQLRRHTLSDKFDDDLTMCAIRFD